MKHILIIDDEINICVLLRKILSGCGFTVDTTLSGNSGLKMLKEKTYDLVFCDYRLKDKELDGASLLKAIQDTYPHTPVVIMTGYPDVRIAIRLIKEGANDYLLKPFTAIQIQDLANRLTAKSEKRAALPAPVAQAAPPRPAPVNNDSTYVYGESEAARELYRQIKLVAPTDYSTIIRGETGTGKEAVARMIHRYSKRRDRPFVALDCGCLSDELAASELFGHSKGAFTGADNAVTGAFREAQGGTLFLDEIGNLSYNIQVALLRVVQERVVRPVGTLQEIPVDIRLIVASNEDPAVAVERGAFRSDLFYRLNEFCISVPSLRERIQDLPFFIKAFLANIQQELGKQCGPFSEEAMQYLLQYHWPGNIRELKNVIRRACLLSSEAQEITAAALPEEILEAVYPPSPAAPAAPEQAEDNNGDLKTIARRAEYHKIINILKEARYNKTRAAELMNIDRKTLYNKLRLFNIEL